MSIPHWRDVAVLLALVVLAGVVLSGCATPDPSWPVPPGLL